MSRPQFSVPRNNLCQLCHRCTDFIAIEFRMYCLDLLPTNLPWMTSIAIVVRARNELRLARVQGAALKERAAVVKP